jgi:hypothetical protein
MTSADLHSSLPTAEEQLGFLSHVQRLLDSGRFTATYKFALFLVLAELAIERGDDSGAALRLPLDEIASRFLAMYWPHATPYAANGVATVLQQNTGQQAAIIGLIENTRATVSPDLEVVKRRPEWPGVLARARSTIVSMPLTKLQTIGSGGGIVNDYFLYSHEGIEDSIELLPGVAFCMRRFFPLLQGMVRGKWLAWIQAQNHAAFGATLDLESFMFGSTRANLDGLKEALWDLQRGRCFYRPDVQLNAGTAQVDHFIPWAKYPCDVVANFVLASPTANRQKSDHLATTRHLRSWCERNVAHTGILTAAAEANRLESGTTTIAQVAAWAYGNHEQIGGLTWDASDGLVPLDRGWRTTLGIYL